MDIQSVYPNFEITSSPIQTESGTVYKGMLKNNQGEAPYKLLVTTMKTKALFDETLEKLGQATGRIYCKSTHDNYGYTVYILAEEGLALPPFFVEEQIEKAVKVNTSPPLTVGAPPDLFEGDATVQPEKTVKVNTPPPLAVNSPPDLFEGGTASTTETVKAEKPVKSKKKSDKDKKRKWPMVLLILFLVLLLLGGATLAVLWYTGFFDDAEEDDHGANQPYISVAPDSRCAATSGG